MAPGSTDLDGSVILVTGASSGLGARFARVLAAAGAQVVAAARRVDRLAALTAEIAAAGGRAHAVALDVTDEASIIAAFDAAEAAFGTVTGLVNNAGVNARAGALEISAADWDYMFAVNTRGPFLCAREAARRMIAAGSRERGFGRIVNVASIGALKPLPGLTAYCSSKAAVAMMTRSLARDWARQGINVNAICPGYIETELNADFLNEELGRKMVQGFPRRRLMREEDLDDMILYLAGPRSAAITGSVFALDDGQTL
ncbi:MAG: SDR family NAD(P)-dependent oxidoreductase [Hyphomonadaceae bacterium]|nr:SDR family NAD(P)-dependent oxidoreductase [Hyphomonadaceae bacterium]